MNININRMLLTAFYSKKIDLLYLKIVVASWFILNRLFYFFEDFWLIIIIDYRCCFFHDIQSLFIVSAYIFLQIFFEEIGDCSFYIFLWTTLLKVTLKLNLWERLWDRLPKKVKLFKDINLLLKVVQIY